MRVCTLLLALAATAAADPSIRWIDTFGNVQAAPVEEVLEDTLGQVRVRLAEGRTLTLESERVLQLVRERDAVPEERALLLARLDADAGERLAAARPVLDRVAEKGPEPWMREYAEAARAVLAERAGEKDAAARLDAFLKERPESRLVPAVMRARARLEIRALRDAEKIMSILWATRRAIAEKKGSFLERFGTYVDATARVGALMPGEVIDTMSSGGSILSDEEQESADAGLHIVAASCRQWARMGEQLRVASQQVEAGAAPLGPASRLVRFLDESGLLLPELRCDLHAEAGRLFRLAGRPEEARTHLEQARELAPDARRRGRAERALAEGGGAGGGGGK